jgi:hypothetical protein
VNQDAVGEPSYKDDLNTPVTYTSFHPSECSQLQVSTDVTCNNDASSMRMQSTSSFNSTNEIWKSEYLTEKGKEKHHGVHKAQLQIIAILNSSTLSSFMFFFQPLERRAWRLCKYQCIIHCSSHEQSRLATMTAVSSAWRWRDPRWLVRLCCTIKIKPAVLSRHASLRGASVGDTSRQ